MEVTNESNTLNIHAERKPSTTTPSVILHEIKTTNPLITSEKTPKVAKVIGIHRTSKIGLIDTFSSDKTIVKITADLKLTNSIPSKYTANP